MRKIISILLLVLMVANLNVYAADLEYTALYVGSNKAFVNDVEQVKRIWGIKEEWLYPAKEGVRGEVSVLIKNGLEESALNIVVVNKNEIKFK